MDGHAFALHWRAHGLGYAVPAAARAAVDQGAVAVCNVSRAAIDNARNAFRDIAVVLVTASREVIAARLASRSRESVEAINARLDREAAINASVAPDCTIVNDGSREAGGEQLVRFLQALRANAASWAMEDPGTSEKHQLVIPAKAGTQ